MSHSPDTNQRGGRWPPRFLRRHRAALASRAIFRRGEHPACIRPARPYNPT